MLRMFGFVLRHIVSGCFLSAVPFDNYRLPAQSSRYITYQWEMSVLTMFEDQWKSLFGRSSTAYSKFCLHTGLTLRSVYIINDVTNDVIRVSWVKNNSWILSKINKLFVVLDVIRYNYHCIIRANSARGEIFYNADIEGSIDRTAHYSVRRFCYISSLKQFWQECITDGWCKEILGYKQLYYLIQSLSVRGQANSTFYPLLEDISQWYGTHQQQVCRARSLHKWD